MTVHNAKKFIQRAKSDAKLRDRLYDASSAADIDHVLSQEQLGFNEDQFVEAYSMLLANSSTSDETEELQEFFQWWNILRQS